MHVCARSFTAAYRRGKQLCVGSAVWLIIPKH